MQDEKLIDIEYKINRFKMSVYILGEIDWKKEYIYIIYIIRVLHKWYLKTKINYWKEKKTGKKFCFSSLKRFLFLYNIGNYSVEADRLKVGW